MVSLHRLGTFVAVVNAGSFTAAADILGQTRAVVSFNIKQLEAELGVALLIRTTRRLAVTEVGERFYQHCQRLLQDAEFAVEDARRGHGTLSGTLRITTTPEYGIRTLVPIMAAFMRQHPHLTIQHACSSQHANLISERFDVAIRLGQLVDSSYRAALIETFPILPVASPMYLRSHKISCLEDLRQAQWVAHSRLATPLTWQVQGPDNGWQLLDVTEQPKVLADTSASLQVFARKGAGIALLPEWLVAEDLVSGLLQQVLPQYRFPEQGVYALYPNTQHVSEKVRAFIDFLRLSVKMKSA
ncbi:LysR family transcriptional regulator [Yersinia entomophaga]|uniref:LysR family transcriptional regulator n=1 Tax=Yersinia entomophaga TaxID=935293 RepID=A0ABM6BNM3_YERET|nr:MULTISPECIES: LysR family transcriptional regulator [Yersinia]ANI31117.1 LysR family transcriptional regulator [Yersinia entomophaga]